MRVLSVASEIYPLIKTGGLADVAGALPPALSGHGVEVRSLVPGYPAVMDRIEAVEQVAEFPALLGVPARLLSATSAGLDLLVLDAPSAFDRAGGPYGDQAGDYGDNWIRFAMLARAACDIAAGLIAGFRPDLVHAHDWQAAMAPAYLRYRGVNVPSVLTVHNIAFQGQFGTGIFGRLELPAHAFAVDGVEYYGSVGYLKAGLVSAAAITTVSPTYAREITTPAFGMGLHGLINARAHDLYGIVNGIDCADWNPETDEHLPATYSARKLKARGANRAALEARFGLDSDAAPIFVVVSRLTWQKGMDLLAEAADALVAAGGKLAVLGSGDAALETRFLESAGRHEGRVGVVLGYDEPLAHAMQGGGDAILIPSRFEPCGLTQLYGLRYGCVPVVARTGGLADTVIDANLAAVAAGVATGVQFDPDNAGALVAAIEHTIGLHGQPVVWSAMQRQGMKADVSWQKSAGAYAALFASLVPEPGSA